MTYISLNFYIFVLASAILYYLLPMKARWWVLLAADIAFYAIFCQTGWWLLLLTAAISYGAGLLLERTEGGRQKAILTLGILLTILPWVLVKAGNWTLELLGNGKTVNWIVPIGISFYTMQIVAYLSDVRHGRIKAQKNPLKYLLFISFFPQLIQGPIPRYEQLGKQLFHGHRFDEKKISRGIYLIIWGFFLKLMIADRAAVIVNTVYGDYEGYTGIFLWLAAICYCIQLYTDFLACTTLAQGISLLFGIELMDNFARPYFADSVKDFWRRWHISLSTWLRDYIYIPLGGSRKGKGMKYVNLCITFLVSGFWHGTGFHYLAWGLINAGYQIGGELTEPGREKIYAKLGVPEDSTGKRRLKQVGTFLLFIFSVMIFRADSIMQGLRIIKHMFCDFNPWVLFNDRFFTLGLDAKDFIVLALSTWFFWWVECRQEAGEKLSETLLAKNFFLRALVCLTGILVIVIFGSYGMDFNAQDFIYGAF